MSEIDLTNAPVGAEAYHPEAHEQMACWYMRDQQGDVWCYLDVRPIEKGMWTHMGGRQDFPAGSIRLPAQPAQAKVVSIGDMTPPDTAVPETVALLERMLARAKSGELRSVAVAGVKANGGAVTEWNHEAQFFALAGSVAWLQHRLHQ